MKHNIIQMTATAFEAQKIQTSLLRSRCTHEDDMDDIWFQQDGATCHTANVTIDLLHAVFENQIISRNSDVNWPPRSCDLTPLNYFL